MNRYQISSALGKWVVYAHNEEQASLIANLLINQDGIDFTIHCLDKEEKQMTNWYDHDNQEMVSLPPVGEIVFANIEIETLKVKILEHTFNGVNNIAVCRVINDNINPNLGTLGYYQNFYPLDWKKKKEKKELVRRSADELVVFNDVLGLKLSKTDFRDITEHLYNLGYLKLPESK